MSETSWPENIFLTLNGKPMQIRRQTHNGKDLPLELTDFIQAGGNVLVVVIPPKPKSKPRSPHVLAVEVVETLNHSSVMDLVRSRAVVPADVTLAKIKTRLAAAAGDDGGLFVQQKELSIDLADPFASTMFTIPARGSDCIHLECFDLETWFNTRPAKAIPKCYHKAACQCKSPEPSLPDKWKCPICFRDARPYSLVIDGFLQGVREKLEAEGHLAAKSLLVAADGTFQPVIDNDDDEGSDGEDTARHRKKSTTAARPPPAQAVIVLDDD